MNLIINPGSTSTKIALYNGESLFLEETITHDSASLATFHSLQEQLDYRIGIIDETLHKHKISDEDISGVVGRGGLLRPVRGGVYRVNERMLDDLKSNRYGIHASNLGAQIAYQFASRCNIDAFIVDPVVVDEFMNISRISGLKGIDRRSVFHALNSKAVARDYAKSIGKTYQDLNIIVAHLGGGSTVGMHAQGSVIDVVNGLDGEGSFTPERTGSLPLLPFLKAYHERSIPEITSIIAGSGGVVSYFNTNDMRVLSELAKTDDEAKCVMDAYAYQVSKDVASMATAVNGDVDQIIITGGVAHSETITNAITQRVSFIAGVSIIPGEKEMEALNDGLIRVQNNPELIQEY